MNQEPFFIAVVAFFIAVLEEALFIGLSAAFAPARLNFWFFWISCSNSSSAREDLRDTFWAGVLSSSLPPPAVPAGRFPGAKRSSTTSFSFFTFDGSTREEEDAEDVVLGFSCAFLFACHFSSAAFILSLPNCLMPSICALLSVSYASKPEDEVETAYAYAEATGTGSGSGMSTTMPYPNEYRRTTQSESQRTRMRTEGLVLRLRLVAHFVLQVDARLDKLPFCLTCALFFFEHLFVCTVV